LPVAPPSDVECTSEELPVTYPCFADMTEPGDDIYLGRYLVSGADTASLYLKVGRRGVGRGGKMGWAPRRRAGGCWLALSLDRRREGVD
jgi:hypothetical protein